ncbi:hypothetical protein ACXWTF_12535 [Thiomicrolovo sp. ZZH C-3]
MAEIYSKRSEINEIVSRFLESKHDIETVIERALERYFNVEKVVSFGEDEFLLYNADAIGRKSLSDVDMKAFKPVLSEEMEHFVKIRRLSEFYAPIVRSGGIVFGAFLARGEGVAVFSAYFKSQRIGDFRILVDDDELNLAHYDYENDFVPIHVDFESLFFEEGGIYAEGVVRSRSLIIMLIGRTAKKLAESGIGKLAVNVERINYRTHVVTVRPSIPLVGDVIDYLEKELYGVYRMRLNLATAGGKQ